MTFCYRAIFTELLHQNASKTNFCVPNCRYVPTDIVFDHIGIYMYVYVYVQGIVIWCMGAWQILLVSVTYLLPDTRIHNDNIPHSFFCYPLVFGFSLLLPWVLRLFCCSSGGLCCFLFDLSAELARLVLSSHFSLPTTARCLAPLLVRLLLTFPGMTTVGAATAIRVAFLASLHTTIPNPLIGIALKQFAMCRKKHWLTPMQYAFLVGFLSVSRSAVIAQYPQ